MRASDVLRAVTDKIGKAPPWLILSIGWFLVIVYGYPGMMTMDSIQQLQEARAGFYTDLHPAVMARLWHYVDRLIAGPFGMYAIQTTAFMLGLYYLMRRAMSAQSAALAASLLFIYPPILAPMGVIWKDCVMAGCLALGTAGICSEQRKLKIWGLVAFVFGTAVRYNAPAATLPLIVILFTWLPTGDTWKLRLRRYAIATGAWFAVTLTALLVSMVLTDKSMHPWHSTLALFDTAGTLSQLDETIPDAEMRELFAGTEIKIDKDFHETIKRRFKPVDFEPLIHGDGQLWEVKISGTEPTAEPKREAFARMFWTTVTTNFGAYVRHRIEVMRPVLAIGGPVYSPVMMHRMQYKGILENVLTLTSNWSPAQTWMQKKVLWVAKKTPLFRPWLYLVLAIILLAFTRGHRDVFALLMSGIGLEAGLLLLAPTPDYRYSHWLVIATCVSIVILVARRAKAQDARTSA